jgi:two-component system, OmpR family, response regulator
VDSGIKRRSDDGPSLRVLCIDDNADVADSEVDLLRIAGFEARACYSGIDAINQAITFSPSMCLIDLNMPGMDGDELARRLRALLDPAVILVAITAMHNLDSSKRVRDAGFDLHLIKPVDPHKLLILVNQMWQNWEARAKQRPRDVPPTSETSE